jgi:hypothetical protein
LSCEAEPFICGIEQPGHADGAVDAEARQFAARILQLELKDSISDPWNKLHIFKKRPMHIRAGFGTRLAHSLANG